MNISPKEFALLVVSDPAIAVPVAVSLSRRRRLVRTGGWFLAACVMISVITSFLLPDPGSSMKILMTFVWVLILAVFLRVLGSRFAANDRELAAEVPISVIREMFGMSTAAFAATVSRRDVARAIEEEFGDIGKRMGRATPSFS